MGWAIDWSPNGKVLRFNDRGHLWQVTPSGRDLHDLLPSWTAWEGRWTTDGSYYIFTASKDGRNSLWAVREPSWPWWRRQPVPVQLTFPPVAYATPLPSRDGHSIYAAGGLSHQIDVVRFDPTTHRFKPVLPDLNVEEVVFSPDHDWMVYAVANQLWRSRPDGTDRRQLAGGPSIPGAHGSRWSPDSKRILFAATEDGERGAIYLVSAEGGPLQQPLPPDPSRLWPDWSPDAETMVYSVEEGSGRNSSLQQGLYTFDFAGGRSTMIPGSEGLSRARWSPDGRFLAAASEDMSVMKLLDLKTSTWTEVAHGTLIAAPVWSADSVLYFQDILAPGEPVYRFQPGGAPPRRAYSFEDILQAGAIRCAFWGFASDGSLLVQVSRGGGDIYALTVNLP